MIDIHTLKVEGIPEALHGMRNPKDSWNLSDTELNRETEAGCWIGENDWKLALQLSSGGSVHAKYRRMIFVWADITAPLYWWKEFDTYKVGTVANSTSTMHKIQAKEFSREDFSCDRLTPDALSVLDSMIEYLEGERIKFVETKEKSHWHNMIQLLPSSFNQMRTVSMNYEVLINIYYARRYHKLAEWHVLCEAIEKLPYADKLILVKGDK